ncbi:unnamed protein product [Symbiodinium microadriaticum]|nr:unnamed protein product [Symbiodinium microadriaticum]CAE7941462.1 unnamed protein product [Symbiodinium sp. KB8]
MFLTSLMGEAKIETKELTSLNAATHQPAISDPDRALHYKLVLAGGPKQTSKELLDEELWVPTEGQLSLLEEVCETMLYKKDENDELLGDWKEMWANQVEVDAQPCRSAATGAPFRCLSREKLSHHSQDFAAADDLPFRIIFEPLSPKI